MQNEVGFMSFSIISAPGHCEFFLLEHVKVKWGATFRH